MTGKEQGEGAAQSQPVLSPKSDNQGAEGSAAAWPNTGCCMGSMHADGCVCGLEERALRGWIAGRTTQPMTAQQREYCLNEIGRVEGYSREDHEAETDAQLARTVLGAWTDYCRDKGLL